MPISQEISQFIRKDALDRFLAYVRIHTTSDEESGKYPSTQNQFVLARKLKDELLELGLQDVEVDEFAYVYARLPASPGAAGTPISFLAHLDTSPAVSGQDVKPRLIENYDGKPIRYPDDPELVLDPSECPALLDFKGETIVTASGKTLLGADDKAGIAEIMAGLAAFKRFPQLKHPELRICFTPDEEIGAGTAKIRVEKLGKVGYTFDGSVLGELEDECFDAMSAKIKFGGVSTHPGDAKNKMVNAGAVAARFVAALPEWMTPEHTEGREGFFHLTKIAGADGEAEVQLILRDFVHAKNEQKVEQLEALRAWMLQRYPSLKIELTVKEQYRNMKEVLDKHPHVVARAREALQMAGVPLVSRAIRGGTDGARLSFMGIPTPNIFTGGVNFHAKKEWVAVRSLEKATEVFLHLCEVWARA